jgi:predicted site-specific integrase-resolvase
VDKQILNSRDVMQILSVCENTLLEMERDGRINIDFRIGNRKRYYTKNIFDSLTKLNPKKN